MNLNDIFESITARAVLVAFVLFEIGKFMFFQEIPTFVATVIALVLLPITAFLLEKFVSESNVTSALVIGTLSYVVYAASFIFFKIGEFVPVQTAQSALIFGAITAGVFLELRW